MSTLPEAGTGLLADERRAREIVAASMHWPSLDLTPLQAADLELLLSGAYAPLAGFMTRAEADEVVAGVPLAPGVFWPVPLVLEVDGGLARAVSAGCSVALRDAEGVLLGALRVAEVWEGPPGAWRLAGPVEGVSLPLHYDYRELRLTPAQARSEFRRRGWTHVLAMYPGPLLHRAHQAALLRVADRLGAGIFLHVPVGAARLDTLDHFGRVRGLEAAAATLGPDRVVLALVPLPERAPEVRRRQLRALVARNFGCTHLALDLEEVSDTGGELGGDPTAPGIEVVVLPPMRYQPASDSYVDGEASDTDTLPPPSVADIERRLAAGEDLPEWMVSAEEARALQRSRPPRRRQGFTVFFTGLSGSGKSTIANALRVRLLERTGRPVTLLDGDLVRKHLSSELGFSREHRDLNILRIGYVASEITRHGGIAICAPIAPFDTIRRRVREMIARWGGFVLVHVATPLDVCEQRDRKGLYAKARAGLIPQFTGVSDPYEPPADAALNVDTTVTGADAAAEAVIAHLVEQGYLEAD
jgi:sulfate adenylyltransferase